MSALVLMLILVLLSMFVLVLVSALVPVLLSSAYTYVRVNIGIGVDIDITTWCRLKATIRVIGKVFGLNFSHLQGLELLKNNIRTIHLQKLGR